MVKFKGFPDQARQAIWLPEEFFLELLPAVDQLDELKVILWAFWMVEHQESGLSALTRNDFAAAPQLMASLGSTKKAAQSALDNGLERAVRSGALLRIKVFQGGEEVDVYFLNTARGRAAIQAIERGEWRQAEVGLDGLQVRPPAPNLFQMYEENIGPLTPLIADELRDAEETYPVMWIEEAIRIAVQKNARNWRYILAILKRWQTEGRHERKDRPDTEKSRRRYVEGEYAEYLKHKKSE